MIRLALGVVNPKWKHSRRIDQLFMLYLVAHIYNLKKFGGFYKAQRDNMCKVDHQALSYVKVLSETSEMNITGTLPQAGNLKLFVPSLSTQDSTWPKQNIFNV